MAQSPWARTHRPGVAVALYAYFSLGRTHAQSTGHRPTSVTTNPPNWLPRSDHLPTCACHQPILNTQHTTPTTHRPS